MENFWIALKVEKSPGFGSLRIYADLQDFQIFADMCRSAEFLQIFAEMCRFEKKTDVLRNTIKTPQRCQTNNKKFITGEKSHLCQNDETFFCSNL